MTDLPGSASPLASFTLGEGASSTVLLHGFLGSGKNLRTLAQRWLERDPGRRFLLPDLRGHGDSPALPAGADSSALGADVLAAAAAAGFAPPLTLVGHSLGGRVALAAAALAPAQIAEVILLDIAPGPVDPAATETRRVLDVLLAAPAEAADRREVRAFLIGRGLSPALADWLLMNLRPVEGGFRWRIDRQALAALHDRFNREDLWPVVESRTVPVRCVRGARSSYVSEADARRLQAAGCTVDTLEGAGHYVHVDALEALVDALCR
jgi:pimeloyl-ACP methyl ester carboxylesterase